MTQTRLLDRIEKFIEVGIALSTERDTPRLLEMILLGAKAITNADGGTLYSVQEDGSVRWEIIRTDSLDFAMGGTTGEPVPFSPIPLHDAEGRPNHKNVVTYAVLNDRTVNIADAYNADGFDFAGTRQFDERTGYRSTSFLTVPMKNHEGDIIGVLQLLNAQDENGRTIPFDDEAQRLTEALASQAAIALTNRRLIEDLKELFQSFVQLIADAIDEKSPFTGGHCRRVPVLTMLLAEAAEKAETGPLSKFTLNDDERYELELAAWLHDCGKITTPEYLIDKATKLEAVFDRIALVQSRFEILRRDARIEKLERELTDLRQGRVPSPGMQEAYRQTLAELEEERRFLQRSNIGGEFMSDEDQARVEAIAKRAWVDAKGQQNPLLDDEETASLTVRKGTLTEAERTVINNHIASTIRMLESLPFPKKLRNVPEFAGGHHERMDGRGYPRGLTGDQMSVQARIMAIADVFEALTAKDRPYKPAKKLSEVLRILQTMKENGHIDPDLFDLFVREKVYLQYARDYLDPAQIDTEELLHIHSAS